MMIVLSLRLLKIFVIFLLLRAGSVDKINVLQTDMAIIKVQLDHLKRICGYQNK
jgi:hypothetical protein